MEGWHSANQIQNFFEDTSVTGVPDEGNHETSSTTPDMRSLVAEAILAHPDIAGAQSQQAVTNEEATWQNEPQWQPQSFMRAEAHSLLQIGQGESLLEIGEVAGPEDAEDDTTLVFPKGWPEKGAPKARGGLMRAEVRSARVSEERPGAALEEKEGDRGSWWDRKQKWWGQQVKELTADDDAASANDPAAS